MKRPQLTQEIIDRNYPEASHVHDQVWFDAAPLSPIEADRLSPYRFCALCQEYKRIGDITETEKRRQIAEQRADRMKMEETSLHKAAQLAAEEIVHSILTVEPTNRINDARRFAEIIYRNVRNQREL